MTLSCLTQSVEVCNPFEVFGPLTQCSSLWGSWISGRFSTCLFGNLVYGRSWTGYFDDFSTLSRPELQNNTAWAVDSLFGLIGLDYAREGAKAPDFSPLQDVGDTGWHFASSTGQNSSGPHSWEEAWAWTGFWRDACRKGSCLWN